ncbi:MAG: hypothetical protein HQL27_03575 [Candidatus Omnitrophica bacterium]|nr:hypothetical protein [Candidatus Omnitrophota bacterium]
MGNVTQNLTNFMVKHKYPIVIIFSLALWVFCFKEFWLTQSPLQDDGVTYYYITKYYLENISRLVYPLWSPFRDWGKPDSLNLRFLGEFNPYLIIPLILYKCGLPFTTVYFIYAISYYFLGAAGFYFLARRLYKDRFIALIAFLLLLFSSSGINVFFNYCKIVIWVPAIWFFYFLLSFHEKQKPKHFLGMCLMLMLIMTTYLPFYFITLMGFFIIGIAVLFPAVLLSFSKKLLFFICKNKLFSVICLVGILLASLPGVIWFTEAGKGEYVYHYRQAGEVTLKNAAAVGKSMIDSGGAIGPLSFERLFSGFYYARNHLSYFFLPVLAFLVLLLSLLNGAGRLSAFYIFIGGTMFLLSVPTVSGFHDILFKHVYYFKFMRNTFYFLHLAVPFLILLVVGELKSILSFGDKTIRSRALYVAFIVLAHAGFALFLFRMGNVPVSSYLTVVISMLFFVLNEVGALKKESLLLFLLVVSALLIQPAEVFFRYSRNNYAGYVEYDRYIRRPYFSYRRYLEGEKIFSRGQYIDRSGMEAGPTLYKYEGLAWSANLLRNVKFPALENYIRNKFLLYDNIAAMGDSDIDWKKVENNFANLSNQAFVLPEDYAYPFGEPGGGFNDKAQVIRENSDSFRVEAFDLNEIRLRVNFLRPKFLVYNDSFHSKWKGLIDGKPVRIIRANVAFKGVWVAPGEHKISFRYGRWWEFAIYWSLILFFIFYAAWLIKLSRKK